MAKFRSLLFREMRIQRKQILANIISCSGCAVLFSLIMLSCRIGNLSKLIAENDDAAGAFEIVFKLLPVMFSGLCAACAGIYDKGLIGSDVNSGWANYACAIPVRPRDRAAARTAFAGIMYLLNILLIELFYAASCAATGKPLSAFGMSVILLPLAFAPLMSAVLHLFTMRARTQVTFKKAQIKATAVQMLLIFLAGAIPCGMVTRYMTDRVSQIGQYMEEHPFAPQEDQLSFIFGDVLEKGNEMLHRIAPWVIPAIVLLLALDYLIICYAARKGERV